jgi:SAM-dependent methyltransferase
MTACQGCGSAELDLVVSLGSMPPVNAFLTADQIPAEEKFPLDVYFCQRCTLVQLYPIVDPRKLFTAYNYLSSASRTTVAYLVGLAGTLAKEHDLTSRSKVLEIGSNDGTLLAEFKKVTSNVLGVDPARNLTENAAALGVRTVVEFFSSRSAETIKNEHGAFDLILALNVVAHTPGFVDLFAGVRSLLEPGGCFVMEVAYVLETILRGEIDTIYHEHVYSFSLHALSFACERVGLTIVDARKTPVQGGSLRLTMQATTKDTAVNRSVTDLLAEEVKGGVNRFATYAPVAGLARDLRDGVRSRLQTIRKSYDTVVGLGAPARGVVLMNYCDLSVDDLEFVVDDTPLKQGKLVPGRHIPVRDWTKIAKDKNIACLMLSWNYRSEVLAKLRARTSNARVLIPLPVLEEITLGRDHA